jgi:tRNA U34 5-carboxymethylaminomethyl modifying enzyme MnmG/GidA
MHTDLLGIPVYSKSDILDIIYQGKLDILNTVLVDIEDNEFDKFNSAAKEAGITELKKYHPLNISAAKHIPSITPVTLLAIINHIKFRNA